MTDFPTLLLASTSPHRQALLGRLGAPFACVAPGVDEQEQAGETPPQRAARLARAKATAVASQQPTAIVIGSDQVASLETESGHLLLHKPGDRANCLRQLRAMSGRMARFDTALAVMRGETLIEHADITLVRFRVLSDSDIERYMDREPSFDCAGGFKCEGLGVTLFESVETRDPTALIGLPLIALCAALRQLGVVV
jgi:septum formation protein